LVQGTHEITTAEEIDSVLLIASFLLVVGIRCAILMFRERIGIHMRRSAAV
jgi:hypothetical protein